MQTKRQIHLSALCIFMLSASLLAQPAENPQTFCNPLNLNYRFMNDAIDARQAADPVIVLFHDDYYLFASRSGGYWTSTDLRNWTLIVPTGLDIEIYAPGVVVMRDSVFFIPSGSSQIFRTGDPKSGVWQEGPKCNSYGDPAFFLDDDGRLYMYYGLSNSAPTRVVELDPITFQEISSVEDIVFAQASTHGWERRGDDNLLDEQPWIEGCWMIKENDTYYLHYAGPGTEFKTYADGIYVANAPMGPFEYADYSPFSFKPTGFICGAGHGCTFKDKDGQYWHIGTMTISVNHDFERRLGLYPVDFDEDGHIRCNTDFGDYPQYYPGEKTDMIDNSFAGMMLLSYKKKATASSSLVSHNIELAVDEEVRTYWIATSGDSDEWMMIDLGKECSVEAIQVNFAEYNTNPDIVRGRNNLDIIYHQYILEISTDGMTWSMLVDKSHNLTDVPDDYFELETPVITRYIKLSNVFMPGEGYFAIRDFRIFGNSEQTVFTQATGLTIDRDPLDGRDAIIKWSPVVDADGYIIRYGIEPDKLYNNYMVYDVDSVAIHSLNHGVDYYFEVEAFDNGTDYYQPVGEFKSSQSGNWSDVSTWARHDGSDWIQPAPSIPDVSDGSITILDGHIVTVTGSDSADQLTVASGGTLVINKGVTFKIKDGIGVDLMVEGTVENYGILTSDASATLTFVSEGVYAHRQNGGTLPTATWKYNSTCLLDSIHTNVPWNGNQNFYNIVWNSPDQNGARSLDWDGNTIGGNIIIQSTGTGAGKWLMCSPSIGETVEVTINGNIIQSGGHFTSNGTMNENTTITINQKGNIEVTGGNFSVSRRLGGSGSTTWYLHGDISLSNCTTQNSNSGKARFVFAGEGSPQTLTLDNVTFGEGGLPVEVDSGATLDMGTTVLQGNGIFSLKAGATLLTAHENGLDGSIANTGTKTFDSGTNYGFNGTAAQVTGNLMPAVVNGLIIDNSAGITLSSSVTVNGTMEMIKGVFSSDGSSFGYGTEASLKYSGSVSQTTTDSEFPADSQPKNLIIDNRKGVTLHDSRSLEYLDLSAGKLKLEENTLTVNSTSGGATSSFAVTSDGGILKINSVGASQVFFPVGTSSYTPVWITNTGTIDTISVGAMKDNNKAPYGGRVKALWHISENTAGGGNYTLRFGWTGSLEDIDFRNNRKNSARIFLLTDTTEVGTGDYTTQFSTQPYTVSRAGIINLGPFGVGMFGEPTEVKQSQLVVPVKFSLNQNYPNPFNPNTMIHYTLGKTSKVKLIIYDILGKEVATLVNAKLNAGDHTAQWNTENMASGIYIYKLITKDFIQSKKMMLLK